MNRINLIALGVRDVTEAMHFYRNIGFKTHATENEAVIVFFDNQGSKLELYPLEELAKDISADNPPPVSKGFHGITLAINMKSKQEVDAFMETVVQHGGSIAKKPEMVSWGGYSGYFQDPDGYYWEVAYGPNWKFDENNMLVIDE